MVGLGWQCESHGCVLKPQQQQGCSAGVRFKAELLEFVKSVSMEIEC